MTNRKLFLLLQLTLNVIVLIWWDFDTRWLRFIPRCHFMSLIVIMVTKQTVNGHKAFRRVWSHTSLIDIFPSCVINFKTVVLPAVLKLKKKQFTKNSVEQLRQQLNNENTFIRTTLWITYPFARCRQYRNSLPLL